MEKTMTEARADALMEDGFHCSQCVFRMRHSASAWTAMRRSA